MAICGNRAKQAAHQGDVYKIAKKAIWLGTVEAPDKQAAVEEARKLLGILNPLKDVPDELITLTAADHTELVLAKSTAVWWHFSPGPDFRYTGRTDYGLANSTGRRRRSRLRRLLHVADQEEVTIRRDLGATEQANNNAEWKAATVLAGATIEALLHSRLQEPSPGSTAIQAAVTFFVTSWNITQSGWFIFCRRCFRAFSR